MDGERERLNQRISELTEQLSTAKTTIQNLETIDVRAPYSKPKENHAFLIESEPTFNVIVVGFLIGSMFVHDF